MTNGRTVFIIGAGASQEIGLPNGDNFKKAIANALDIRLDSAGNILIRGDRKIYDALCMAAQRERVPFFEPSIYSEVCLHIRDAMPQAISIDHYINDQSDDKLVELCSKLAIIQTILQAEARSKLNILDKRSKDQLDYTQLMSTWFNSFRQLLTENCRISNLEKRLSSIVLIIFNYDRCVEHYLYYAFQNYYKGLSAQNAAELIQHIKIYHPYGTVGTLPWLKQSNPIDFGESIDKVLLLQLVAQIKTFTEGTDIKLSEINAIRENIKTAHRYIFLGFAFHRMNLELLLPLGSSIDEKASKRKIFATANGISKSDVELISTELEERGFSKRAGIQIRNELKCNDLFHEFKRNLSFI